MPRAQIEIDIPEGYELVKYIQESSHDSDGPIKRRLSIELVVDVKRISDSQTRSLTDRIASHLRQMAPHVRQRLTGTLLSEALCEIERLEAETHK